jgi:hypothetical protein
LLTERASDMKQKGGDAGHLGILLQGANGSLWFMRDDSNGPTRVPEETADRIKGLLGKEYQDKLLSYPLSSAVIGLLNVAYGPIQPDGVIHGCATKPPGH